MFSSKSLMLSSKSLMFTSKVFCSVPKSYVQVAELNSFVFLWRERSMTWTLYGVNALWRKRLQAVCYQGCCLQRVRFLKNGVPFGCWPISQFIFAIFKQGASRGAASGGSDFWKMVSPRTCWMVFLTFLHFSSRVPAGVLRPAGQIFEKWRPLEHIEGFSTLLWIFQAGC